MSETPYLDFISISLQNEKLKSQVERLKREIECLRSALWEYASEVETGDTARTALIYSEEVLNEV